MQPDEAADILGDLPKARSEALLGAMEEAEAEEVRELLSYDPDTAGALMNTDFSRPILDGPPGKLWKLFAAWIRI